MSQKRKMQRANKSGSKKGAELAAAMTGLTQQMTTLEGMEKIPALVKDLGLATERAARLADAMVDDYEMLLKRIETIEKHLQIEYVESPESTPDLESAESA